MEKSVIGSFLRNKKGVELTLNTVIIAILVVLVLVLLIGFFLGGTTRFKEIVGSIFRSSSAGTDVSIARDQCKSYCTQAQGWAPDLVTTSPYCSFGFKLDIDGNGEADLEDESGGQKVYKQFKCSQPGTQIYTPCDVDCNGQQQAQ